MIIDVFLAVPMAAAVGAVPEFHLGMRKVGDAAGRAGVERFFPAGELAGLLGHAPLSGLHAPVDVPAEEQEKVADRCKDHQARAPEAEKELIRVADPGEEREPLDLYWENKKNIDLKFRIEEGKGKKHRAADKNVSRGIKGHDERDGDRDEVPDQEKDIVPESAPMTFQGAAHEIKQVPGKKGEDGVRKGRNEQKGNEPPPLAR